MKLTPAQTRILKDLANKGGRASRYDLGYPRGDTVHRLVMSDLIEHATQTHTLAEHRYCDLAITDAGRVALEQTKSQVNP